MHIASERRDLELLVALDETGTLHAAGKRLHVTASALSQQLRELERRLGGPLFARQWRRLVANAAGRRCIAGAHELLAALARLESETRQLIAGASGTIRLAAICQQSYRWLPELLVRYRARYPDIDVRLVAAAHDDVVAALMARAVDVAIIAGERPRDPRIAVAPLFRDELVAVVADAHPWAARARVAVEAFANAHVITDPGALASGAPLGRALAAARVAPAKVTYVPLVGTAALDFARASWGVAIVPRWTVAHHGDLHAVRIGTAGLWLEWAVICRDEPRDDALAALIAEIRATRPSARAAAPRPRRTDRGPRRGPRA